MKKIILFAAILFSGISVAQAQVPATTAQATLNVNLTNIQSIEVSNNATINLNYTKLADYTSGINSGVLADHLTVSSSGGFIVNVKAADLTTTAVGTQKKIIEANTIQIEAVKGTLGLEAGYKGKFALANADQALLTSIKGGIAKKINVTYFGSGGDAYVDNFTGGKDGKTAVYTTTVMYSIVAN